MDILKEKTYYQNFENIADLLWLSQFTGVESVVVKENISFTNKDVVNSPKKSLKNEIKKSNNTFTNSKKNKPLEKENSVEVHTNKQENISELKAESAKAFQSPKKLALSNYREWEKAFKFINLKQRSKSRFELDEDKSVEQIASSKVFNLVFRGVEEKIFSLTILIDQYETMEIWQELIQSFEQMLSTMGVFYQISVYYWDTTEKKPKLYYDKSLRKKLDESNVVLNGQRTLVWILSDCLAPSWQSGEAFKSIERWSKKSFTSIVQMFPKPMWAGTMLHKGRETQFSTKKSMLLNDALVSHSHKKRKQRLQIPIVSFNPYALQAWARVVVSKPKNKISGIELNEFDFEYDRKKEKQVLLSDTRMKRFYSQASPLAQKLAFYMSVLPIDFQVTRILQEELLPQSNQSHLAEVFLGGIIEKNKTDKQISYEFYPHIREEFLANISANEAFNIMKGMSSFVSNNIGIGFDFSAYIADREGLFKIDSKSIPFARLASRVLQRMGGEYLEKGRRIEEKIVEVKKSIKINELKVSTKNEIIEEDFLAKDKSKVKDKEEAFENIDFMHIETIKVPNKYHEMGKYPITIGQYMLFADEYKEYLPSWTSLQSNYYQNMDLSENAPIIGIHWHDAMAYCQWLSKKLGNRYRLPTEEEWKNACRAESKGEWYFGDNEEELENYAWYRKNTYKLGEKHKDYGTHEVGQKIPNKWGLYDMHGNVFEWCFDWYENEKINKLACGGSWESSAMFTHLSHRYWLNPSSRTNDIGFRILKEIGREL